MSIRPKLKVALNFHAKYLFSLRLRDFWIIFRCVMILGLIFKSVNFKEEGCIFAASSIDKLRDHLTAVHQMSFTVVQKTFPFMDGKEMTEVSASYRHRNIFKDL